MADKGTQSGADWPRTILLASGIFAVGAIGFFLAVVLQDETAKNSPEAQQQLSVEQRSQILNTLNAPASTSPSGGTTGTTGASSTASEVIQPSQADQSDSNAAAKLNALNALNAQ